jgi:hypothetical protein
MACRRPPESAYHRCTSGVRPSGPTAARGEMLTQEPDLPSSELLRRAIGLRGGKSAPTIWSRGYTPARPLSRGVIAPVRAPARVRRRAGRRGHRQETVHFLASQLPYSGGRSLDAEDEDVETLLGRSSRTSTRSAACLCWPRSRRRIRAQLDDAIGWDAAFGRRWWSSASAWSSAHPRGGWRAWGVGEARSSTTTAPSGDMDLRSQPRLVAAQQLRTQRRPSASPRSSCA